MPCASTERLVGSGFIRSTNETPVEAKWMTYRRATNGFYVNEARQHQSSPGFLTQDSWTDPVIKSTVTWVGYSFFELVDGAAET